MLRKLSEPDREKSQHNKEIDVQELVQAISERTDLPEVLADLLPVETLFAPYTIPQEITTRDGKVKIQKISNMRLYLMSMARRTAVSQGIGAMFSDTKRVITICPSKFKGRAYLEKIEEEGLSGVYAEDLSHETLHAHQVKPSKRSAIEELVDGTLLGTYKAAKYIRLRQLAEGDISWVEASILNNRSRSVTILTEAQAYILTYMLNAGNNGRDFRGQIKRLQELGVDGTINEQPLSNFDKNGLLDVREYVYENVKTYLPVKDKNDQEYKDKIHSAVVQILQLLEQGFTHRQIAEMIRDNFDNLQASDMWNADKKEYTFLSTPLQKPAREESELVRDFQQRTSDRYDAVKEVVGEFLHRK